MPSRSRSAAALSLIRSSGLSRSGTIPSGAGLPKPRHRRGQKSHIPRGNSQTGNGHNRFQSRSPWTAPLKEGAIIHHPEVGALRSPKAPRRRAVICASNEPNEYACIFTRRMPQQPTECRLSQSWSAPNQTGDATLPLRWLPPATLLWTCHLGTPCVASCSQPTSFTKSLCTLRVE